MEKEAGTESSTLELNSSHKSADLKQKKREGNLSSSMQNAYKDTLSKVCSNSCSMSGVSALDGKPKDQIPVASDSIVSMATPVASASIAEQSSDLKDSGAETKVKYVTTVARKVNAPTPVALSTPKSKTQSEINESSKSRVAQLGRKRKSSVTVKSLLKRKRQMKAKQSSENENKQENQKGQVDVKASWNLGEKCKLFDALLSDKGRIWWGRLAAGVKTKNVDQVKYFVEELRAKANGVTPFHLPELDNPLQAWILACEQLINCQDNFDSQCIPQVMTIAGVEPTSVQKTNKGPDYSRIYNFLSGVLRGHKTVALSPIEAKVILEMIESLETKVSSVNTTEQVNFLRTKFSSLSKKLEQDQITVACEQLQKELKEELSSSTNNGSSKEGSSKTKNGGNGEQSTKSSLNTGVSSLNPINVPVSLLNLVNKPMVTKIILP